jgi:hypothetical protein
MRPEDFPILDPTHPDGPRKLRPVADDGLVPLAVLPSGSVAAEQLAFYGSELVEQVQRDLPKPPPAELGFDPLKWRQMTRAERRAVLRYAKAAGR